jgi:glucose-6-phosphate 1-epimerase
MLPELAATAATAETVQGQPCIRLTLANGDSALVALHGAHVLSWVAAGRERLYLSPRAAFDGRSAVRGGIPVCWPQFNQRGPLPKHGFARNLPWQVASPPDGGDAEQVSVRLALADSDTTRTWWPECFAAQLTVVLGAGFLRTELQVHNTGAPGAPDARPWDFTTALHTYLHVDDVDQVRLGGLDGCARWDAVADAHGRQHGDVTFAGEYDCVFGAPAAPLHLYDGAHTLQITQSPSFANTVVWNPGSALCARLPDMPPDGWRTMLCVEAAQIDRPVTLVPGAHWQGWQELRVLGRAP